MPRQKKAKVDGDNGTVGIDSRSKDRKAIDRARSFVARLRALARNGPANLEDAVELCEEGGASLNHDEHVALTELCSEAGKLLLYFPVVSRMVTLIGETVPGKASVGPVSAAN